MLLSLCCFLLHIFPPTQSDVKLAAYHPKVYNMSIGGKSAAEVGGETILHMRAFQVCQVLSVIQLTNITPQQAEAKLPNLLVDQVKSM